VDSNSEIQGYNVYPMLHFRRKFSSGIIVYPTVCPEWRAVEARQQESVAKVLFGGRDYKYSRTGRCT